MKRLLPLALAALLVVPGAARAQELWSWSIIIPSVGGTDVLGSHLRNLTQEDSGAKAPPLAPAASASALRYTADDARRSANFAKFISDRRRGDPAAVRDLQQFLATPNLISLIDRDLRKYGLRTDNVADAYTAWWIQMWQTAHADMSEPSLPAVSAVKAQAERAFLATPAIVQADDAAKQAFAEGLLVQMAIAATALEHAKTNPAQVRMLQQMARQGGRQNGLDLDAMRLTDEGFKSGAE